MQTIPDAIANNARDGVFSYVAEIEPNAGDSWSMYRWAEHALAIDDNDYTTGKIYDVSRISTKADIRTTGAAASKDSVTIKIHNDSRFHEELIENNILGRIVKIYLAPIAWNRIKNSSFERYSGSDFEEWTENTPGSGGVILGTTSDKSHGSACCWMYYAGTSPAPQIYSNEFTLKKGEYLSISLASKLQAGTGKFKVAIYINGFGWQFSTRTLGVGLDWKEFTAGSSWGRTEIESLHWSELGVSALTATVRLYIQVDTSSDGVYLDDVLAEPHPEHRAYIPNAIDLLSSDILQVYEGEVRDPDWDDELITVYTNSILDSDHKDIPVTLLTQELSGSWKIPVKNEGKPFPMTYGGYGTEHFQTNYSLNPHLPYIPERHSAMGLLVSEDAPEVYFDRPGMKLYAVGQAYHFHEESLRYFQEAYDDSSGTRLYQWAKDANNGGRVYPDPSNADHNEHRKILLSYYLRGVSLRATVGGYGTIVGTAWDGRGYPTGFYASIQTGTAECRRYFSNDQLQFPQGDLVAAYNIFDGYIESGAGAGSFIKVELDGNVWTLLSGDNQQESNSPWGSGTYRTQNECDWGITLDSDSKRLDWWLRATDGSTFSRQLRMDRDSTSGEVQLYGQAFRLDFTIPITEWIPALACEGREFQDSWGSRRTAGTVINWAWDVIESVLRDELSVAGAGINTTKFDAVNTLRSGGDYAIGCTGQVLEITESEQVVEELCHDGGLVYYIDLQGKHAIASLEHRTKDFTLRTHGTPDFVENSVKVGYTRRRDVYNNVVVKYFKCPFTGDYSGTVYCNRTDSNFDGSGDQTEYEGKCAISYAALGNIERQIEIEVPWISSKTSAERFLKWFIDWNYLQRFVVTGEIYYDNIGIELGDVGELDIPEYIPEVKIVDSVFMVESAVHQKATNTIKISLLEVKDPDV